MDALLIKTDAKTNKIMRTIAKSLGATVYSVNESQYEDLVFGEMMDKKKTGTLIDRNEIFKTLNA
ncbi:MAG: hypothetical protein EAZ53_15860 [Bacteroidetes bacterium]|nr:MAG: hypothetical protein EAZ53_15860 [Bacteroidota bacterium]